MQDDPRIDPALIAACLADNYDVEVSSLRFLPAGYDMSAYVYRVMSADGSEWFLKIRLGTTNEASLEVPRALIELGIANILAPVPTRSGALWCHLDAGRTAVLAPFIHGQDAMSAGLTEAQVREFGATLRAVHESGLEDRFRALLRVEDFTLPSAALVREMLALARTTVFESPAATRLAAFLGANAARIHDLLSRAEEIGRSLHSRPFQRVLCHADIHAANILVGDNGRIWLIDWDGPLIAPRERDLFFIIGSRIARSWTQDDEGIFFEGYGSVEIDEDALVYARYERIVEDIGEFAKTVFLDPLLSEEMREREAALARSFFVPGGDIDRAETVIRHW